MASVYLANRMLVIKALPQGRGVFSVPAGSSAHAPAASLLVQKTSAEIIAFAPINKYVWDYL
jgi:hypothetical protein